jgi:hypothetical protein
VDGEAQSPLRFPPIDAGYDVRFLSQPSAAALAGPFEAREIVRDEEWSAEEGGIVGVLEQKLDLTSYADLITGKPRKFTMRRGCREVKEGEVVLVEVDRTDVRRRRVDLARRRVVEGGEGDVDVFWTSESEGDNVGGPEYAD